MKDKFKDKAIITRFGGEEFAIILPEADLVRRQVRRRDGASGAA
jgi:GGDEF domain-containing protein